MHRDGAHVFQVAHTQGKENYRRSIRQGDLLLKVKLSLS
jgi:hypothetical protein